MGLNPAQFSPVQILDRGVEKLESLSARMGIYAMAAFIAVLVWFVVLGLAGMHLIKLFTSVGACGAGLYLGCVAFALLKARVPKMSVLPDFLAYVAGLLCLLLFFYLAWRMCVPLVYLLLGAGGFAAVYVLAGNWLVGVLVGLALMVAAHYCFVLSVILTTSVVAGVGSTVMLAQLFPKVASLQNLTDKNGILIALGITAFFVLVQWISTPNYRKVGV